jgi:alkylhydroperoxidase family enzyme
MDDSVIERRSAVMARISLTPPKTLSYRLTTWYTRRRYGMQLEPLAAMGHNMPVTRADAIFELQIARWHKLGHGLKDLAVMAAAARIGCAWCMDFGYWEAITNHHVPAEKIRAVPHWRDSDVFSELERLVLAYAEAMTATPPQVTDETVAQLRAHLDEAQLVELTAIVAVENLRSRINAALGLTAQGFKDRCEIPGAGTPAAGATAVAGSAE